jgi:hypothetical protein
MRSTVRGAVSAGVAIFFAVVIALTAGGILLIDYGLRLRSGSLTVVGILLALAGCYAFSLPIRAIRRAGRGGGAE